MKKIKILPTIILAGLATTSLPLVSCSQEEIYDDTTPLCINDVKSDGQKSQITYTIDGSALDIDIEYQLNNGGEIKEDLWVDWNNGDLITLENGQRIFIRNTKNALSHLNSYFKFIITGGEVAASGNVNSMINNSELTQGCFIYLFAGCDTLKRAPALPATTLANNCYQNMFWGCTSLTKAPQLPATNLTDYCYSAMFSGCTSLKEAPKLNSTKLAPHCYEQMFDICGLTQAPVLPAQEMAESCYAFMFCHCPITNTPALPAMTLADGCYRYMFSNCRQLVKTTSILPATKLAANCYDHMFAYCHELVKAPQLMGQQYNSNCYLKMFKDCSKLVVNQDTPSDNLICSFISGIDITGIASEMFAIEGSTRSWDDNGNPIAGHAYYWSKN